MFFKNPGIFVEIVIGFSVVSVGIVVDIVVIVVVIVVIADVVLTVI